MIRSASSAASFALLTPICSTTSSVSRMPAVSMMFRLIPCMRICSSSVSRVVPAISVTIARSSPSSTFIKEDFPAFGFPRMTVRIPSDTTLPLSAERTSFSISPVIVSSFPDSSSSYPSREICSGSSNADSIKAIWYRIRSRKSFTFFDTEPFSWLTELFTA